jgi:hypothetical protein
MEDHATRNKRMALTVWGVSAVILLGPSLLVWIVRGTGYAVGCEPGPGPCHGMTLGGGLGDTLSLAWSVGTNLFLLIVLSFAAMLAAFFARRPMLGTLSLLLLPILSLLLPMMAVYTAKYDDCPVSADGIGSCVLWGAPMGMSFHTAASAADMIFAITPYCFALAVMMGLGGWFFARPKPPPAFTPLSAQMRRIGEDDSEQT